MEGVVRGLWGLCSVPATLSQVLGQGQERQEGLGGRGRWIGGTPKGWEVQGAANGLSGSISLPCSIGLREPGGTETALSCHPVTDVLSPCASSELWESRSWTETLRGHMGVCVSLCYV